ncbi:MAG: Ig-like domain-containing protein, partial [Planctomycetaceae bacterium]
AVLARDDIFSTDEDTALVLATVDLTANDSEFDGDAITITGVSATSSFGATVTLDNGTISYEQGALFDSLGTGETLTDTFTYTVDDGQGSTDTATVSVTITGVNDDPEIVSAAAASVEENSDEPALTVEADDVDSDNVTFSIVGGADAALFMIDPATGALRFINSPDFENPADAGGDNVYDVTVSALDEHSGETSQDIAITVTDVVEAEPATPRINEVHYDNDGADGEEFIEIRVAKDADVSGLVVELYNGNGGTTYGNVSVSSLTKTSDEGYDYYVWEIPGIQNGSPDGIALSDNGTVIEFLSYEGTFTATNGTAAGLTSNDIVVSEPANTPTGQSLQRTGDGPTDWEGPGEATPGAANGGGTNPGDPTELLISEIQGTGSASFYEGTYVLVSAVVTYTVDNGFFLQEEATDADGNVLTSEGIFVFTGGAPSVSAGDLVDVAGTVDEFFGLTEITNLVSINTITSGHALPDFADVRLPLATADALERFEGMRISLTSGTANPITVVENFNLDRYGEITVSAGDQYQPTQLYDPDTNAAEIAALTQANALNRLIIDDGVSGQNPDSFRYVPASVGDNGNGYLDFGDTFSSNGPTLRLGADMSAPIQGVLSYGFDAYRMHVDGVLPVDQATNMRPAETPADVGGDLKIASFNLLNLFTTLRDGSGAGSGPNNLEPRGAATAADLARQLDKAV